MPGDPTEPRGLGLWLAHRASVPFTDLSPREQREQAREEALDQLREKLSQAGPLGRLTLRMVENLETKRRPRV